MGGVLSLEHCAQGRMGGWEVQSPPEGSPGWNDDPGSRGEDQSVWETSSLVAMDGGEGGAQSHTAALCLPPQHLHITPQW